MAKAEDTSRIPILAISITVEGANILTRSMIIFGQGAVRAHPYVLQEMLRPRLGNDVFFLAIDQLLMSEGPGTPERVAPIVAQLLSDRDRCLKHRFLQHVVEADLLLIVLVGDLTC